MRAKGVGKMAAGIIRGRAGGGGSGDGGGGGGGGGGWMCIHFRRIFNVSIGQKMRIQRQ